MTAVPPFDPTTPHAARRCDYWLGGKDNFAADRESADLIEDTFPTVRLAVQHNRAFLRRVTTVLAAQENVTQFLDIGAGLPAVGNTHEIAQQIAPAARVVYVDNDPLVLAHARALHLPLTAAGHTAVIDGDLRHPAAILTHPDLHIAIDLDRPVAVLLTAVLPYLGDADRPNEVVRELLDALPSGSWLALTHISGDLLTPATAGQLPAVNDKARIPMTLRTQDQIARFFQDVQLTDPGLVPIHHWRPTSAPADLPADSDIGAYGGLARKP